MHMTSLGYVGGATMEPIPVIIRAVNPNEVDAKAPVLLQVYFHLPKVRSNLTKKHMTIVSSHGGFYLGRLTFDRCSESDRLARSN